MSASVLNSSSTKSMASEHSLAHSNISLSRPASRQNSGLSGRKSGSAAGGRNSQLQLEPIAPEYLRPQVRSAVRRWKKTHEETMIVELVSTCDQVKQNAEDARKNVSRMARRIPVEVLAKEWLNLERASIETRAFLIESLFPTVILGLEKLLQVVQKRNLALQEERDPNFNPINFLAQYLMRNNPKFSNFSEASPYIHGLRAVSEELRQEIYTFKDNKLAQLKANAKKKKEERERANELARDEYNRKQAAVAELFADFLVGEELRIDFLVLQKAIKSFTDVILKMPAELHPYLRMVLELEVSNEQGKKLGRKDFSDYFFEFIEEMPFDVFEQFQNHMQHCALTYRKQAEKEIRRVLLSNVFITCDQDEIGMLDRPRILKLFEMFYDRASDYSKTLMRNPGQWPVREYHEVLRSVEQEESKQKKQILEEAKSEIASERQSTQVSQSRESTLLDSELNDEDKSDLEGASRQSTSLSESPMIKTVESSPSVVAKPQTREVKPVVSGVELESTTGAAKPSSPPVQPSSPPAKPSSPTTKPSSPTAKPSSPTAKPSSPLNKPSSPTAKPETDEVKPSSPTAKPSSPTAKPSSPTAKPSSPTEVKPDILEVRQGSVVIEPGTEKVLPDTSEPNAEEDRETTDPVLSAKPKSPDTEPDEEKTKIKREVTFEDSVIEHEIEKELSGNTQEEELVALDLEEKSEEIDVKLLREDTGVSVLTSRSKSTAFDEQNFSQNQFVRAAESFLGENPKTEVVSQLAEFIREAYVETEEERLARIKLIQQRQLSAKRKVLMDELFILWDNDASGFLDLDEVDAVVLKFKDGLLKKGTLKARKELKMKNKHHDNRLSKREFREYLKSVLSADLSVTEECVNFLTESVQRSFEEKVRGQARKKWLIQIRLAGEQSGASMDPIYRAVYQALYKDSETHGDGKRVSANIAMLESNSEFPDRGNLLLRFVSATPEDADIVVGQIVYEKDEIGVSFQVVESGKPLHIPRVINHDLVRFFNTERDEDEKECIDGAFVVVPLKDRQKRVFGTLGVDTLSDPIKRKIFSAHEIQFYQGIANAFSIAYHKVDGLQKTMRVAESALIWICRRVLSVKNVTLYMKEVIRSAEPGAYCLRKVLTVNSEGEVEKYKVAPRLGKNENVFRDYLFISMDNSETVSADAYGEHHIASPLRDLNQMAIAVLDISIGKLKKLNEDEERDLMKILRLLQLAQDEITKHSLGEPGQLGVNMSAEALFDRFMLEDLREHVALLSKEAYAELRSYKDPPATVLSVIKAVLSIFHSDEAATGQLDRWGGCQKYVKLSLGRNIIEFDPHKDADKVPVEFVDKCLSEVPHNMARKHGSRPTEYLFNWLVVCLGMARNTMVTKKHKKPLMPSLPEEPTEAESEFPVDATNSRMATEVDK